MIARALYPHRNGSIYVLVLGLSALAVTMAVGGLLAARSQARAGTASADVGAARIAAESGVEIARLWISQDANWRTTRANGNWVTDLPLGAAAKVSIDVVDPVDASLSNRPHDSVQITAWATVRSARQAVTVTLDAQPTAMPALECGILVAGELHVKGGKSLRANDAIIATNKDLDNEGIIEGNVEYISLDEAGTIIGTKTTAPARMLPATAIAESYAALGTQINSTDISNKLFSPSHNPYGTPQADGVYVIRSSTDVKIKNTRIVGTLVVICGGKKVVLEEGVVMQPARPDFPALIIDGEAEFVFKNNLAESGQVNYNPSGAPYEGLSDNDKTDSFPSVIQGLIHVTGKTICKNTNNFNGCLIVASTSGSDALIIDDAVRIKYDPSLLQTPPQFYTSNVRMVPRTATWRRKID